jgi:hypothetical protein
MTTDNTGSSEKPGTVSQCYLLPSLSNNPGQQQRSRLAQSVSRRSLKPVALRN